jgi:hypothetical protein
MSGSWEEAYQSLQPTTGGVQPPAKPGNMGNISYAPGMMSAYQGGGIPRARDLYSQNNPGMMASEGPINTNTPMKPSAQPYPGGQGMTPPQARGFLDALKMALRARGSVAATRGGGMRRF